MIMEDVREKILELIAEARALRNLHEAEDELERIIERLQQYPNVVGVGLGYKVKGGVVTDTPAIIVYVKKKVPREKLRNTDIIPEKIYNVETDVIEVGEVKPLG